MRRFPNILIKIIDKSGMNINQISKVSGISNTYLNKLKKKQINHPGKDKIASILLALNYSITAINKVLASYDYMPLNDHDIPEILEHNKRRKFEGRIVPNFNYIHFELVMAALENIGGTKIIVKRRPSDIFVPMELYMMKEFPTESSREANSFFNHFTQAVVAERKTLFMKNCQKGFGFETYMCRKCLEQSFFRNFGPDIQKSDPRKIELGMQYFANAVSTALKAPEQHKHRVVKKCGYFQFQLQDAYGKMPKVSFSAERRHQFDEQLDDLTLESFLSDDPSVIDIFRNEINSAKNAIETADGIDTPDGFHSYVRSLFALYGIEHGFDSALSALMDYSGLKLY
jgi:transcriptional regulator with XRE-family HTH domain